MSTGFWWITKNSPSACGVMFTTTATRVRSRRSHRLGGGERTFVQFILEPLYKIFSQVVGETTESLLDALKEFGIKFKPKETKMNTKPLLKLTFQKIFGDVSGLADMLAEHIPTAEEGNAIKVDRAYSGPIHAGNKLVDAMKACDVDAPPVVIISKLIPKSDCSSFDALGRVMCGTLKVNDRVRVLGERTSPQMTKKTA